MLIITRKTQPKGRLCNISSCKINGAVKLCSVLILSIRTGLHKVMSQMYRRFNYSTEKIILKGSGIKLVLRCQYDSATISTDVCCYSCDHRRLKSSITRFHDRHIVNLKNVRDDLDQAATQFILVYLSWQRLLQPLESSFNMSL